MNSYRQHPRILSAADLHPADTLQRRLLSAVAPVFATDIGEAEVFLFDDVGERLRVPRYGIWADTGRGYEILATGDDLEKLRKQFGLPIPVREGP